MQIRAATEAADKNDMLHQSVTPTKSPFFCISFRTYFRRLLIFCLNRRKLMQ